MLKSSVPVCYFPSTTLFLDDSRDVLLNVVLELDENIAYRVFDIPSQALEYIESKRCQQDRFYHGPNRRERAKRGLQFGLSMLHQDVYNPDRFTEVSVVVVNYVMPGTNGIHFCRCLESSPIKKILLIGQADEPMAIAALNEGIIDCYIKKNDPNLAALITESIYDLQFQYFQAKSDLICHALSVAGPAVIYKNVFVQFFQQLCGENNIVEYYMLDSVGSYLMLDEDANTSFLMIKDEKNILDDYQRALSNGASQEILQQLSSREKIVADWWSDMANANPRDCLPALISAQRLLTNEASYFAYLRSNNHANIRQQKILSYHRYLEELDAEVLLVSEDLSV